MVQCICVHDMQCSVHIASIRITMGGMSPTTLPTRLSLAIAVTAGTALLLGNHVDALDNGLGETPAMGWYGHAGLIPHLVL